MREAQLEAACVKYAKSKGWTHSKLDPKGNVGVPDHIFFGPDRTGPCNVRVVEFKYGRNAQTPKQIAWAVRYERLTRPENRDRSSYVWVVRSLEEFKEIVDD